MHLEPSILKCVSKDKTRIAIGSVYLDVDEKLAIATDGHVMALVPIDPDPDEVSGYVSAEAILQAGKQRGPCKYQLRHLERETVIVGSAVHIPNPFADETPPTFPDWKHVVPSLDQTALYAVNVENLLAAGRAILPAEHKPLVRVSLDLAKHGTDPVILQPVLSAHSPDDTRDWSKAMALVMPVKTQDPVGHTCPTAADQALALTQAQEIQHLEAQLASVTERLAAAETAAAPGVAITEAIAATQQRYDQITQQYTDLLAAHQELEADHIETLQALQALVLAQDTMEVSI